VATGTAAAFVAATGSRSIGNKLMESEPVSIHVFSSRRPHRARGPRIGHRANAGIVRTIQAAVSVALEDAEE